MNEKSNQENSWNTYYDWFIFTVVYSTSNGIWAFSKCYWDCNSPAFNISVLFIHFPYFWGLMKKHKYKIRVFQCPDCGNKAYAAKSIGRMTVPGHMKYLWCAHCKEVKNMTQIE